MKMGLVRIEGGINKTSRDRAQGQALLLIMMMMMMMILGLITLRVWYSPWITNIIQYGISSSDISEHENYVF